MSFRASLVDDFIAESTISALVDTRVFDMFFEFEDFLNSKANAVSSFPAITIESDTGDTENNLDSHDNLIHDTLSITILQQVNLQKLRSKNQAVRNKERDTKRQVDTVADAVTAYILDKRGVIDTYFLRASHISNDSDGILETEGNREIVTREISYVVTYSKISQVPVNITVPVVTGDLEEDDILTTTDGTWTNSPSSFTYKWLRDDVVIAGQTASTYTITATDLGTTLKSQVIATDGGLPSLPAESVGTEIPSGTIERNFTTLDPAFSMYATLDTDIELASGDLVRINATTSTTAQDMFITDGDTLGASIELKADGSIEFATSAFNSSFTVDGVSKTAGVAAAVPFDGKQHALVFTSITATQIINFIASDNAVTTTFKGILSNFEHERSSVILRNYEIKEDWSANLVLIDTGTDGSNGLAVNIDSDDAKLFTLGTGAGQAGWIGEEVIIGGDFSNPADWTIEALWTIAGGTAQGNGANGAGEELTQAVLLTIGSLYVNIFDVESHVSGSVFLKLGNVNQTSRSANGTYEEVVQAITTGGPRFRGTNFFGSIDNVSVKQFLEIA